MSDRRAADCKGQTRRYSLPSKAIRTGLAELTAVVLLGLVALAGCSGDHAETDRTPLASNTTLGAQPAVGCPSAAEPSAPHLYGIDPALWVADVHKAASDRHWKALTTLKKDEARALAAGPWTVTTSPNLAPGGDPHQYVTLSRYWWPNPSTTNGLPFVRRDGQTDPLVAQYPDETDLDQTVATVTTLAHAYALLGDQSAASRAAVLLRTFFLDPSTAMAPDATYSQVVPGQSQVRGDGVLDTRVFIRLVDDLTLLAGSTGWTPADNAAMSRWLSSFLDWLQTSPVGQAARAEPNNHGTWYDAELASLALYLGRPQTAQRIINHYVTDQEPKQISRNGSQPLELARSDSWYYTTFNLDAAMMLSLDARYLGTDLYACIPKGGGSIGDAIAYTIPFATGSEKWTHQGGKGLDLSQATLPIYIAANAFHDSAAAAAVGHIHPGEQSEMDGLTPVRLSFIGHTA